MQQQIIFYSTFTDTTLTNVDKWSFIAADPLNVIQQCGPYSIIGGFQTFALNQAATKFLQLPSHYKMKISLTLFIIGTWDVNEQLQIYVDENLQYNTGQSFVQGQIYICGQTGNNQNIKWKGSLKLNKFYNLYIRIELIFIWGMQSFFQRHFFQCRTYLFALFIYHIFDFMTNPVLMNYLELEQLFHCEIALINFKQENIKTLLFYKFSPSFNLNYQLIISGSYSGV